MVETAAVEDRRDEMAGKKALRYVAEIIDWKVELDIHQCDRYHTPIPLTAFHHVSPPIDNGAYAI